MKKNILFFFLFLFIVGCKKNVGLDNLVVQVPETTALETNIANTPATTDINKDSDSKNVNLDPFDVEEPSIRNVKFETSLELKTIYFDYDSTELNQKDKDILSKNAKWLKENSSYKVLIEGHTDQRGSIKYNLGLGQDRASKVRLYLTYLGIEPERIATISYGKEKLVSMENSELGFSKNRRAEFFIYKTE
jgi:peptidoglycan-associated lipoprotein